MHNYMYFNHYLEDVVMFYSWGVNILTVFFDVSIVLIVFILLTWGRLKQSLLWTYLITLLWSFVNVFYARFFNQYLPLSIIAQSTSLSDQAVMNSMLSGFQAIDLYYILSIVLFIYVYCNIGSLTIKKSIFVSIMSVPFISFLCIFVLYSGYHFLISNTRGNINLYKQRMTGLLYGARNAFPNSTRFTLGSIRVIGGEIYDMFYTLELTEQQRKDIEAEISRKSLRVTDHKVNPNIKNIVFVVLESFLSSSIDLKVDGKEITPYLNSLKLEKDTYYNGHVVSNIKGGESADGQFVLMTGLLPLRSKFTVGEVVNHNIPAIPQLFTKQYNKGVYSEIVIPSPPNLWLQDKINQTYGIKHMYCNKDIFGNSYEYLNDEQVFTLAMNSHSYQHQPFFSLVLSYSTHHPYNKLVDDSFSLNDPTLPNSYINYLIACHYTDVWLQKYFSYLKQKGVYDNSLVIITADHHAHLDALEMEGRITKELPLFIINGKIDKDHTWTGKMNQLDIYTTILDVLGIDSNWYGLGHTILCANYQNSVTERAWELSDLIIRGHYFD